MQPHEVPDNYSKKPSSTSSGRNRSQEDERSQATNKSDNSTPSSSLSSNNTKLGISKKQLSNLQNNSGKGKSKSSSSTQQQHEQPQHVLTSTNSNKNRSKLDETLFKLLSKMPKKNAVDASYLLETDKRSRKRKVW